MRGGKEAFLISSWEELGRMKPTRLASLLQNLGVQSGEIVSVWHQMKEGKTFLGEVKLGEDGETLYGIQPS